MKLVAVADIHGAHDRLDEILSREGGADVIIVAGDVTTKGTPLQVEEAVAALRKHGATIVAVAGNMDPRHCEENLRNLGVSINASAITVGDAGFFGVSASPVTPFHTPYEIPEDEIARRAEEGWRSLPPVRWKVFVPHSPPKGTEIDRTFTGLHAGSTAVRLFVERNAPDLLICGHIHEARGVDRLGNTTLVNCGPAGHGHYAVITLGDEITVDLR
jgi:uncharacterized protein